MSKPPKYDQAKCHLSVRVQWSAFLTLAMAVIFAGCAITPEISVNTEQLLPLHERTVVVLPSSAMSSPANASRLAQLVSDELIARGYKVEKSPEAAKLVVIASFSRIASPILTSPSPLSTIDLARSTPLMFDTPGMTQSRLRGLENDISLPLPTLKAGLIVTAFSRENWQNADAKPPKIVWRTTVIMPQYGDPEDILTSLVKAAGPQFP